MGWSEVGRDLGRTSSQCYGKFHESISFYEVLRASTPTIAASLRTNSTDDHKQEYAAMKTDQQADTGSILTSVKNTDSLGFSSAMSRNSDDTTVTAVKFLGRTKSRVWSADEDQHLLRLVEEHKNKWKVIGLLLNRTNKQVSLLHELSFQSNQTH